MKINKNHLVGLFDTKNSILFPSIDQIRVFAKQSELFQRAFRVLTPEFLVVALLATVSFAGRSAREIALEIGICGDIKVSRVAIWKRLKSPAIVEFLQLIIEHVMAGSMADPNLLECRNKWLKSIGENSVSRIKRVLIGDASTFTLHPSLALIFPGSKNQTDVPKAHLKLQLVVDLLTGKWVHFSFDSYRRSDMKAALDFMPFLEAGDLLIRDLGYALMDSFQAIIDANAFFISRLKANYYVYDKEGNRIKLRKVLQKLASETGDVARIEVYMSKSHKIACTLVARRDPKSVGNLRRRKIKEHNKTQGFSPPEKRTLQLQDWTILVTNLEPQDAYDEQLFQWYQMRWRIENIFKACKSHTSWLQVAQHRTNQYHVKALVLSWFLTMVILAHRGAFRLARFKIENGVNETGPPDEYELEIVNFSILKSIGKLIESFGYQLELAGAGFDCFEHNTRMVHYMEIHNTTEPELGRISLVEILAETLDCEF